MASIIAVAEILADKNLAMALSTTPSTLPPGTKEEDSVRPDQVEDVKSDDDVPSTLPPILSSTVPLNAVEQESVQVVDEKLDDGTANTTIPDLITDLSVITISPPPRKPDHPIIFHFIRHGEALHNIPENPDRWDIRDPGLTPIGIWQCKKLRAILPANRNIRSIFYSPMIRTIDTTLIVFKDEIESGKIPNTAWWSLREWGSGSSATGSSLQQLQKRYGDQLDVKASALLPPGWEYNKEKRGDRSRATTVKAILVSLAKKTQRDISEGKVDIPESVPYEVAIVSHGGFLQELLKEELSNPLNQDPLSRVFCNANMKSFSFDTIDGPSGVRCQFTETVESKNRPLSWGPISHFIPKKVSDSSSPKGSSIAENPRSAKDSKSEKYGSVKEHILARRFRSVKDSISAKARGAKADKAEVYKAKADKSKVDESKVDKPTDDEPRIDQAKIINAEIVKTKVEEAKVEKAKGEDAEVEEAPAKENEAVNQ